MFPVRYAVLVVGKNIMLFLNKKKRKMHVDKRLNSKQTRARANLYQCCALAAFGQQSKTLKHTSEQRNANDESSRKWQLWFWPHLFER